MLVRLIVKMLHHQNSHQAVTYPCQRHASMSLASGTEADSSSEHSISSDDSEDRLSDLSW